MARTFHVASQLNGCLTRKDPLANQLNYAFSDNVASAEFTFDWAYQYVSTTRPAGTVFFCIFFYLI